MHNYKKLATREFMPFTFMIGIHLSFIIMAFILERPAAIWAGFLEIITSRSILVTDYIAVGGIGATLVNVAIAGLLCVSMLLRLGMKPGGGNLMAIWITMGFAFFGKNIFNMIPLTVGVWIYSKYVKQPFSQHYVGAVLVATLSPAISELAFQGEVINPLFILVGVGMGFLIGFIFPAISADSVKVHSGFNLYNMGFTGGLIAMVLAAIYRNHGLDIVRESIFASGYNHIMAPILYGCALAMIVFGFVLDKAPKKTLAGYKRIHEHSGRLLTDYYQMYKNSTFLNMGMLCALSTTVVLVLGAEINGSAAAGILTMTSFGSLGKHLKNVIPIMIGTIAFIFIHGIDVSLDPANIIFILFATALAPIAGAFGWIWGIIAGFLHINIATYIGYVNEGLNLYNNGFAATFVVMFLLPVISIFNKKQKY